MLLNYWLNDKMPVKTWNKWVKITVSILLHYLVQKVGIGQSRNEWIQITGFIPQNNMDFIQALAPVL